MSNILVFNLDGEQVKHYYQWDSAQHIVLHDVNVNDTNNVHFCNVDSEQAIVVDPVIDGNKLVVRVPDELLQVAKPLIIYVYRTDENTGNQTVRAAQIIVIPRPRPNDYVYTATESLSYAKLDRKIDEMAKTVKESIKDAVLYTEQAMSEEQKAQARENIGAASKEDLEGLDFMPPEGDPEAEVRFDVAHAQMVTAPEFVIADPESSTDSILLTKEGAEEGKEPRKAVMLTDPSGKPVVMSNVANPEKETDAANKKFVREQVDEISHYLEDLVYKETIQVYGAEAGQLLKVKAVDENGHPTEWETADGEKKLELLIDYTVPENCDYVSFTTDQNGKPFDLSEAVCAIWHYPYVDENGTNRGGALSAAMCTLSTGHKIAGGSTVQAVCHGCGVFQAGAAPETGKYVMKGFYLKSIDDYHLYGYTWYSSNGGSLTNNISAGVPSRCWLYGPSNNPAGKIYGKGHLVNLHLGCLSNNVGAGTHVMLWGVRK